MKEGICGFEVENDTMGNIYYDVGVSAAGLRGDFVAGGVSAPKCPLLLGEAVAAN